MMEVDDDDDEMLHYQQFNTMPPIPYILCNC